MRRGGPALAIGPGWATITIAELIGGTQVPWTNVCTTRDAGRMILPHHEIEGLRRSAAMAPLSASHVQDLLETAAELSRRQKHIAEIITTLGGPFTNVRSSLNEIAKLVS